MALTKSLHNAPASTRSRRAQWAALFATLWLNVVAGCRGEMSGSRRAFASSEVPGDVASAPDAGRVRDGSEPTPLLTDNLSNEAVLGFLPNLAYREGGFRRMNSRPFPSIVASGKQIVLWVSAESYTEYAQISADRTGSGATLPTGTTIIREVYAQDELDTITVMTKLEHGAFALGGDWFYVATDANGKVRNDVATGAPILGLTENCGTCHLRRSRDDYLFGIRDGYLDQSPY